MHDNPLRKRGHFLRELLGLMLFQLFLQVSELRTGVPLVLEILRNQHDGGNGQHDSHHNAKKLHRCLRIHVSLAGVCPQSIRARGHSSCSRWSLA